MKKPTDSPTISRRDFTQLATGALLSGTLLTTACPPQPPKPGPEVTGEKSPTEPKNPNEPSPSEPAPRREVTGDARGPEARPEPRAPDASRPEPSLPEPEPVVETPPVDLNGRKYYEVDLNEHPDMKKIGWYIDLTLPNKDLVQLFRRSATNLVTISVICTHKGCVVGWRSTQNRFVCPCHAGTFDANGEVTGGPPPRSLKNYPTAYDSNTNKAYVFLD